MRRKMYPVRQSKVKAALYSCTLVALTVFALPKLPVLHHGLAGTFSLLWILFVGLALSANIYFLSGADRERSRLLEQREALRESITDRRGEAKIRKRAL